MGTEGIHVEADWNDPDRFQATYSVYPEVLSLAVGDTREEAILNLKSHLAEQVIADNPSLSINDAFNLWRMHNKLGV